MTIAPGSPRIGQRQRRGPLAGAASEFFRHLPQHIAKSLVMELAKQHAGGSPHRPQAYIAKEACGHGVNTPCLSRNGRHL